ncbi:MAG: sulfite exporter TauE/SafE family protein [Bryobacterales bacterium]|nr:sulfite exporter TauE/SafE family protein [Bryobacterales bacterium]
MPAFELTIVVAAIGALAGLIGALTGLGGGVIVTPALTLLLGVDMRYAIGASLVSLIATSSGAAATYVRDGLTNIRIGMFLELATTVGAICGAMLAGLLPTSTLAVVFGAVLLYSAWQAGQVRHERRGVSGEGSSFAQRLHLSGVYHSGTEDIPYVATHARAGFACMYGAGVLSGLLGIGSGAFKVLALDQVMKIPFKVSTATSNFMIGVTGVASAAIYFGRGYIHPVLAFPVMLGVLSGSTLGAYLLPRLPVRQLRRGFAIVVAIVAIQMIVQGLRGRM